MTHRITPVAKENPRRSLIRRAGLALLVSLTTGAFQVHAQAAEAPVANASRETIAIIGTGRVGSVLGRRWGEQGHAIVYGSREPKRPALAELVARSGPGARATTVSDAARGATVIVLAVPWEAVRETAHALGEARGAIVIDVTNPLTFSRGRPEEIPVPRSGAELVREWLPGSTVVKAFNTLNYSIMEEPARAGGAVTIPLAGDDAVAKARVARLVRALGLEPRDVGGLANARYLEAMAMLYVENASRGRSHAFEYFLRGRVP